MIGRILGSQRVGQRWSREGADLLGRGHVDADVQPSLAALVELLVPAAAGDPPEDGKHPRIVIEGIGGKERNKKESQSSAPHTNEHVGLPVDEAVEHVAVNLLHLLQFEDHWAASCGTARCEDAARTDGLRQGRQDGRDNKGRAGMSKGTHTQTVGRG